MNFLHADLLHYSLMALGVTLGVTSVWLCGTSWRPFFLAGEEPSRGGRLILGVILFVLAIVAFGIFQDVRLDDLCAVHGTCR